MSKTHARTILAAARDLVGGAMVRDRALQWARLGMDRVVLTHVSHLAHWQRVFELMTPAWMQAGSEPVDDPAQWLQRLADAPDAREHQIETRVVDGAPSSALVQQATDLKADLLVLATPREDRIREFFLGSTALAVLRDAHCPILVTRSGGPKQVRKVMVAVVPDGSEARLADAAKTWCPDAGLHFVHCFELPEEGQLRIHGYTEAAIGKFKDLLRQDAEQRLRPLQAAYPEATLQIENGYAASGLLELVGQHQPDIVVLGAHRGTRVGERFLGSVAQFMLYNAGTDLLLVP